MNKKIIAIVITVVITAGTATGVGVTVSKNNDKQTEELVSAAVSEALATAESSTTKETTESITEPTTAESTTTKTVQKAPKLETTTAPQIVYDEDGSLQPVIIEDGNNYVVEEKPDKRETTTYSKVIETPTGNLTVNSNIRREDDQGYYWEVPDKKYQDPSTGFFERLYVDEKEQLFFFDMSGNRVYI